MWEERSLCACTGTQDFYLGYFGPAFWLLEAGTLAERPLWEPGVWAWAFHSAVEMSAGVTDASGRTMGWPSWRNKAPQASPGKTWSGFHIRTALKGMAHGGYVRLLDHDRCPGGSHLWTSRWEHIARHGPRDLSRPCTHLGRSKWAVIAAGPRNLYLRNSQRLSPRRADLIQSQPWKQLSS